jgi:4-hydroxymandelate oxidase
LGLTLGQRALSAFSLRQSPAASQKPDVGPLTLSDFEPLAKARMSHIAYEYVAGGAGDEITLRENQAAFDRLRLLHRVLVDVSRLDTRVTLFNQTLDFPILLAPTAYHRLVHPEGELGTVRGACAAGAPFVVSTYATTSLEDIAKAAQAYKPATGAPASAASSPAPLWFQLYVNKDRGFTRELVQRAESAGYRALCITVDNPVLGLRHRETRSAFKLPDGLERANFKGRDIAVGAQRPSEAAIYSGTLDPTVTWKDVEWLRGLSRIPVLLKGVLNPDDAATAAAGGFGIIVSNHGARSLDSSPATIDALPRVVDAVSGRVPVLMDGGVRRGSDVVKAIACGASAVLIGRPYLYGLAVQGADGVEKVVRILRRELEMTMALAGRRTLAEIDRSALWR